MPSATISIAQSAHDGTSNWSQRASSNGTVYNATRTAPVIGPHFDLSLVFAQFFILKIDNMPRGSIINNCKIEFREGIAYNNGLTNHIYAAVENNLDPLGTGAIVNGTLGSQPWQRLGRQSAATTLLGNRCGPTHNKAGQSLSTYGAHVRDPSALIYKAFCTVQNDAATLGRELPASSWVQTENIAPALQPLVNDTGWNETTQYILIWLFSDINTGTTFNIGNLANFAWDNGTIGASGYGNGNGQLENFDLATGNPPRLLLDYSVTSLKAITGGSSSSGIVRLSSPQLIGRMRGERAELSTGSPVIPKLSAGAHDLPITGMSGVANPNDLGWNNGSPTAPRMKWGGQRVGRIDGYSLFLEDHAASGGMPRAWWDIGAYQSVYTSLNVYSLRFYHRYDANSDNIFHTVDPHVMTFRLAGVDAFRIEHRYFTTGPPEAGMNLRIAWSGGSTAWTTNRFSSPAGSDFYRYEIQVDANQTPKVRVRIYLNDVTTPIAVLTASPPNVAMDQIRLGEHQESGFIMSQRISDFEAWSDYRLNGQYPDTLLDTGGTPYIPQQINWFEYDGNISQQVDDLGTVASINSDGTGVVMASNTSLTFENDFGEIWDGGVTPYTLYGNIPYGVGSGRRLDLYVPTGTPPAGGWPVIVWTHGGFWIGGTRAALPISVIKEACMRGYAIATCSYVLGALYGSPTPAWDPDNATGRYPSFILNFKEAAHSLQTTYASAYNLNPAKFIASGHSAGGYNALAAVVSKGITNDGGGRNLTLAGNVSSFGCPNVPDPSFIGAYSLAGPINLTYLKAWDPTVPNWPFLGTGDGTITVTARSFLGTEFSDGNSDTSHCNIDDMILINAANIPSICYAWSSSDLLVVSAPFTQYSQQARLAAALNSVAGSLPPTTTYESHEVPDALHHTIHDIDFDYGHFFRWIAKLPGL